MSETAVVNTPDPITEGIAVAEQVTEVSALSKLIEVFTKFLQQQVAGKKEPIKAVIYRKAQARYLNDFGSWLLAQEVKEIVSVTQSESDGNITITLFYR